MTPKEKAKELSDKFQDITALKVTLDEDTTAEEVVNHAKRCAIICVDELLEELGQEFLPRAYKYWQDVKQEIKKL